MDSQADTRRAVDQGSDLSDDKGDSTKRRLSDLDESRALGEHWTCSRALITSALLDRLTRHVHILEMNGESYRLNQSLKPPHARLAHSPRAAASGPLLLRPPVHFCSAIDRVEFLPSVVETVYDCP